ncbi:hypothetical protein GCM10009127_14010 [Alteraurantiacibacter aestuarii]|uniref:DUF2306 domain-containing protein n=1 Tax=Alteraurantiacibacter aestuarii TaxID=650004 RepID=A0A844ZQX2_9SPHN|nr:hypothetical protein [Alteraurantiacibacter aestuarii]MXO88009.1 hypothetical protein [Alteraurantiacibacter aestuarii]
MATVSSSKVGKSGFRPSFHLWLVLAMAAFVFTGFGLTYLGPVAAGTRTGDAPIVHLHGIAFFSWMVLLVVQALLVNMRNVKLHRSLGMFGIAVATLVVVMGVFITIAAASTTDLVGNGPGVFYLSVFAPPSFAILFVMAIRAVKTPVVHRSLILIATISILMPGINRVYMAGVGLDYVPFVQTYMTMNAFLAAVVWHEWRGAGTVSRATWIGAAIVVVPQLLLYPVSSTKGWADFVFWLGSFATYH